MTFHIQWKQAPRWAVDKINNKKNRTGIPVNNVICISIYSTSQFDSCSRH